MKTNLFLLALLLAPILNVRSISGAKKARISFLQDESAEIPRDSVPQNSPCANQPKSFKEVTVAFDKGQLPSASEVTGSWVEIGFFGQDGQVRNMNCAGITRGKVFEFVIAANQYSLTLHAVGMGVAQKTKMQPDNKGSVQFPVDFGGDASPVYRCRISRPNTLTCLNAVYGEGIEFKKMLVREEQIFPKA